MERIPHDRDLFEAILGRLTPTEPDIRAGAMFGSPAVFVGRRMAFCVFGRALGVKLPEKRAGALIAAGSAVAFRPYGKAAMREWVELQASKDTLDPVLPLLGESIAHARSA